MRRPVYHCAYCERELTRSRRGATPPGNQETIDHVWPQALVRLLLPRQRPVRNEVRACRQCNMLKGNMLPLEFLWLYPRGQRSRKHVDEALLRKLRDHAKVRLLVWAVIRPPRSTKNSEEIRLSQKVTEKVSEGYCNDAVAPLSWTGGCDWRPADLET